MEHDGSNDTNTRVAADAFLPASWCTCEANCSQLPTRPIVIGDDEKSEKIGPRIIVNGGTGEKIVIDDSRRGREDVSIYRDDILFTILKKDRKDDLWLNVSVIIWMRCQE